MEPVLEWVLLIMAVWISLLACISVTVGAFFMFKIMLDEWRESK